MRSYLNGSLGALLDNSVDGSPVKSFWWGIGAGIIDVRMNETFTGAGNNVARFLKGSIARNTFNPFHGPLFDQENVLRIPEHSDPKPYDILNMEWIADFIRVID